MPVYPPCPLQTRHPRLRKAGGNDVSEKDCQGHQHEGGQDENTPTEHNDDHGDFLRV